MSDELVIGKTSFDKGFTQRNKTFYIMPGDNAYRILPPMHSLATSGKYAQFHQTHMMKKSDGKWVKFASNEEVQWIDGKRVITQADPIIEQYQKNLETYQSLKSRVSLGEISEDQLKAYYEMNVQPLQPERKYYLNAVNLDNQVSVLALPSTAYKALNELIVRLQEEKGLDATDLQDGVFFNIRRTGKGRDTTYTVEVKRVSVQDPTTGEMLEKYKRLPIGPELLEQVKIHSRDLTTLFRTLDNESMNAIAQASASERPVILDRLFSKSEKPEGTAPATEFAAPGVSGVKGVVNVNVGATGVQVEGPNFSSKSTESPQAQSSEAQTSDSSPAGALSDEEFAKMFLGTSS